MEQFRCKECGSLLAEEEVIFGVLRIKCYSCNTFNEINYPIEDIMKMKEAYTADLAIA